MLVSGQLFHELAIVVFGFVTGLDCTLFPLCLLPFSEDVKEEEAIEVFGEGECFDPAGGGESFSEIEIENVYFFGGSRLPLGNKVLH